MRVDGGVRAEDDVDTGPVRARKTLTLRLGGLDVLAEKLLGPALGTTLGVDVVAVVYVHRERDAALTRESDARIVYQRGMFDRINARFDRLADRACAVRVRRHATPGGVRDLDDRGNLLRRHFGIARHAAECEHRAGGNHLQHVRATGYRLLRLAAEFRRATRHSHAHLRWYLRLGVTRDDEVPASARNRQVETCGLDAGPDGASRVDLVAERAIRPRDVGADVAHGREARHERSYRVLASEGELIVERPPVEDAEVGGVSRPVDQVRVHVDQAGQTGEVPEIDYGYAARRTRTGTDLRDASIDDHDGDIAARCVRAPVDEGAATQRDRA